VFIPIPGLLVHCTIDGPADAPAVMMLHSLGTTLHVWDPQVAELSRRWRVLRPDLRGHGLTEVTPGPYDVQTLARDALALAAALGITSMHVAGLSIGGRIAMEIAALAPSVVTSLALCDTALAFLPPALWRQRADAVRTAGMESIADAVMGRWVRDQTSPSSRGLRQMLLRTAPEGYAGSAQALQNATPDSVAGRIGCPALVVVGDADQSTPPSAAEAIKAAIPDSTLAIIAGGAHIPTFEFAAQLTALLEGWLAQ